MRLRPAADRMTFIRIKPPEPAADRAGVTVGVIMRDEARDLTEWMRFHEYAGVSRFVIYDDGSSDNTVETAKTACDKAEVIIIPWNMRLSDARRDFGMNNQTLAFAHCISNFGATCRWMALIDPDEYLVPVRHTSVLEALTTLDELPIISLPWVMFGRSGHDTHPPGGILRNFLRRAGDLRLTSVSGIYNFKPIFDPCRITEVHVHRLRANGHLWHWNDAGSRYLLWNKPRPSKQSNVLIQLNHYFSRSGQSLREKIERGGSYVNRGPHQPGLIEQRVAAIEADEVEDHAVLDYIARRNAETGRDFFVEFDRRK